MQEYDVYLSSSSPQPCSAIVIRAHKSPHMDAPAKQKLGENTPRSAHRPTGCTSHQHDWRTCGLS